MKLNALVAVLISGLNDCPHNDEKGGFACKDGDHSQRLAGINRMQSQPKEVVMTEQDETATLNELIEVLNDGKSFYEEASRAAHVHADLAAVFQRMAKTKAAIAADLASTVLSRGEEPAKSGSFSGSIRTMYAELRTSLASNEETAYIVQLEEFEDRILHAFQKAVEKSDDVGVREIARRYLPEVTRDHNDMRAMKKIKQAQS